MRLSKFTVVLTVLAVLAVVVLYHTTKQIWSLQPKQTVRPQTERPQTDQKLSPPRSKTYLRNLPPLEDTINDTCNPPAIHHLNFGAPPKEISSILSQEHALPKSLTVITAYFNLGDFAKGDKNNIFTPGLYKTWMKVFASIENPVVAYFDKLEDLNYFVSLRSPQFEKQTRAYLVSREELWSFRLLPRIAEIYSDPRYPQHTPNTVRPDYSCAMHAKYELTLRTISENPLKTRYFCWLDIGLFREISRSVNLRPFSLYLPQGFDESKVAYTSAIRRQVQFPAKRIFLDNNVWLCGCFFIGRASVLAHWAWEYMKFVEHFLSQGLMNTDQQVIYAAFNCYKTHTKIQPYVSRGKYNAWFYLGYLSKEAGEQRRNYTLAAARNKLKID